VHVASDDAIGGDFHALLGWWRQLDEGAAN
jgi:hypothetical protein